MPAPRPEGWRRVEVPTLLDVAVGLGLANQPLTFRATRHVNKQAVWQVCTSHKSAHSCGRRSSFRPLLALPLLNTLW